MSDLRYNRTFKKTLIAIVFGMILFGSMVVFFIISQVQYNRLVSGMQSLEATIVDIDYDVHIKGPDEQEIYVEYVVDGVVYSRELETDTAISFAAGTGAHYSVGDRIPIFYDPQNPEIIASPRSQSVGIFWLVFALLSLSLVVFALWWMIKSRRKFLVTQEEYDQEGDEIKRGKSAEKQQKKQAKRERQKEKQAKRERNKKNVKLRKFFKMLLIAIVAMIIACLLFHFFRGFIRGLTS